MNWDLESWLYDMGAPSGILQIMAYIITILGLIYLIWKIGACIVLTLAGLLVIIIAQVTNFFYEETTATILGVLMFLVGLLVCWWRRRTPPPLPPPPGADNLNVVPATLHFRQPTGQLRLDVRSNTRWTANEHESWLRLSTNHGSRNGRIDVFAEENTTGAPRRGQVTVQTLDGSTTRIIAVIQDSTGGGGGAEQLEVHPDHLHFTNVAAHSVFDIVSNIAWTVTPNEPWITVNHHTGSNHLQITVNVVDNPGSAPRNGTITVHGGSITRTVQIAQGGTAEQLEVHPDHFNFKGTGDRDNSQVISNIAWTVTPNEPWISATPHNGLNHGTIQIVASRNDTGTPRRGTITVHGGSITRTITIEQAEIKGGGGSAGRGASFEVYTHDGRSATEIGQIMSTELATKNTTTFKIRNGGSPQSTLNWAAARDNCFSLSQDSGQLKGGQEINITVTVTNRTLNIPHPSVIVTAKRGKAGNWVDVYQNKIGKVQIFYNLGTAGGGSNPAQIKQLAEEFREYCKTLDKPKFYNTYMYFLGYLHQIKKIGLNEVEICKNLGIPKERIIEAFDNYGRL